MARATSSVGRGRWLAAVGACVAIGMVGAPPARADDAAVLQDYKASDAQFSRQLGQVASGAALFRRTRRAGPLIGSLVRIRALIHRTRRGLIAQQASTPSGAGARISALRGFYFLDRSFVYLYRSVRAVQARRAALARTLAARGSGLSKRAQELFRQAEIQFRQAGLSPV